MNLFNKVNMKGARAGRVARWSTLPARPQRPVHRPAARRRAASAYNSTHNIDRATRA